MGGGEGVRPAARAVMAWQSLALSRTPHRVFPETVPARPSAQCACMAECASRKSVWARLSSVPNTYIAAQQPGSSRLWCDAYVSLHRVVLQSVLSKIELVQALAQCPIQHTAYQIHTPLA
eukprot:2808603-Rhodomonas_salina.2